MNDTVLHVIHEKGTCRFVLPSGWGSSSSVQYCMFGSFDYHVSFDPIVLHHPVEGKRLHYSASISQLLSA
jgi:hypothetical protein